jgi:hypothetical protein
MLPTFESSGIMIAVPEYGRDVRFAHDCACSLRRALALMRVSR